jgi:hypothetical protein
LAKDGNDMKKADYNASFVIITAIVHMFMSVSAMADSDIIEKLDLDKDGQITIKEAVANPAVLASFGKIDTDGNGKISPIEMVKNKVILIKDKNISQSKERI